MELKENDVIGGYRVIRELGKGGMATVYEVEHTGLKRNFALKVFTMEKGETRLLGNRFIDEGRVMCRLDHPNIVKTYDLGIDETTGRPYYRTDLYLDEEGRGASVENEARKGRLSEERLMRWYGQIREALGVIHANGIVHRDIKPGNMLLDAEDNLKLSDFGVARFTGAMKDELEVEKTMVTGMSEGECLVMGTPFFMPQEVRAGAEATKESDYWMVGMSFFRLLTGIDYVPDTNAFELLKNYDPRWLPVFEALLKPSAFERSMPPIAPKRSLKKAAYLTAASLAICALAGAAVWLVHNIPVKDVGFGVPAWMD